METKSLVDLFWEEMGLLLVLIVPILIVVVASLGRPMGHFHNRPTHRRPS
jgi:hypothetical protein